MNKKYALIVKTGESELKAVQYLSANTLSSILPIIELTRGRKLPQKKGDHSAPKYPFDRRLSSIKSIFKGQTVCIDLTSDVNLSNSEIDTLYKADGGYENWVNFILGLKQEACFRNIIPCIILDVEDTNFQDNLLKQVRKLKQHFKIIAYRNNLFDENCYNDFILLKDELKGVELITIIDCGYVITSSYNEFAQKVKARINNLRKLLDSNTTYIIASTSYPRYISDIGDDFSDTFKLVEQNIFSFVAQGNPANLIYGDYGTINPERNDTIAMARGWIPRIDVPLQHEIFYYRERRPTGELTYSNTYKKVATLVLNDSRFPSNLKDVWGITQIKDCAIKPASTSPGFWISVRMNIHIEQQVLRLYAK